MTYWEQINEREVEGFTITTYVAEEELHPAFFYDEAETLDGIEEGLYDWFQVKVTASKNGIKLADRFLGACCYESTSQFLDDDYHLDMINDSIREATTAIRSLT